MLLGVEEELECEICVNGIRLEHVSELNTWDVFWTNRVQMRQCSRKVASERRIPDAIRSLVNAIEFAA